MNRRKFITLLGGAAVGWPLAARAQQPAMPVIGYLYLGSSAAVANPIAAFRQGLAETGYVEGQNVVIDYRFAEGRSDRLPELAAELVTRRVAVIVAPANTTSAVAAKKATSTIPIVFGISDDPTKLGLVASLNHPGGNATGINYFLAELGAKRLGLIHELVPGAARIGLLANPSNPVTEAITKDVTQAASVLGVTVRLVHAREPSDIEPAFAILVRDHVQALMIAPDTIFNNRRVQLVTLSTRHGIPTIYNVREYVEVGGLMSYGTNITEMYRAVGLYTGRILKGARPAELPVLQSTKFEFVINMQTARALGLEVPPQLLASADEVIE
jgi:putative ABC transport system substrate-binding protein